MDDFLCIICVCYPKQLPDLYNGSNEIGTFNPFGFSLSFAYLHSCFRISKHGVCVCVYEIRNNDCTWHVFCVHVSSVGCQEERSRLGDESLLQKALEESKREMEAKAGGVWTNNS